MNWRVLLWVAVTLLAAMGVARVVSVWVEDRVILPYQERYYVSHYRPLALLLADRFADTRGSEIGAIEEEVYRNYFADVTYFAQDEEYFANIWFDDDKRAGISPTPYGAIITIVRNDGSALDIGPMDDAWLITSLPTIVDFLLQLAAVMLVLVLHLQGPRRRMEALMGPPPPALGVNDAPDAQTLFERLLQEHAAMRVEVDELNEETARRLENQRDFLHGVAHEFRGPLARLRFATHLEDDAAGPTIDEIVLEMEQLVTEILQYSRYHHGLFEPEYAPALPLDLVTEAVSRVEPAPPHVSITINDDLQLVPTVVVDEALYLRCLLNLLLNACRFCRSRIDVNGYVTDYHFVLNVDDDGPGIPPGKKHLIFEPFTRLDPSRSRDSGGAGLGLAIVAGIINRVDGNVSAGESPFGGARFTVSVPIDPTERVAVE